MATALVVGGAGGISLETVRLLGERGDSVVLADIDLARAQQAAKEDLEGSALAVQCDLGSEIGPGDAVDSTLSESFRHGQCSGQQRAHGDDGDIGSVSLDISPADRNRSRTV